MGLQNSDYKLLSLFPHGILMIHLKCLCLTLSIHFDLQLFKITFPSSDEESCVIAGVYKSFLV